MSAPGSRLVADIGGTNARFAIALGDVDQGFTLVHQQRFKAADFDTLDAAAHAFLKGYDGPVPTRGCFGVAGPVKGEAVRLTNSPWSLTPGALGRALGLKRLIAVNDFAALARGAPLTGTADRVVVASGRAEPDAPIAVLGPGTGLGLGYLVPLTSGVMVMATEGGHQAFAPRDEREVAVWRLLAREHGYVSFEQLLSGRGLVSIHRALSEADGEAWRPIGPEDVTAGGVSGADPQAREALDVFFAALGTFAADAVVSAGAKGGVHLVGGILPRVRDALRASRFVQRFRDVGPMSPYTADVPVSLVVSDDAGLIGAAALIDETEFDE